MKSENTNTNIPAPQAAPAVAVEKTQMIAVLETNKQFDKAADWIGRNGGNGKIILVYSDGRLHIVNVELTCR